MTQEITQEMIRALSDSQLAMVGETARDEQKIRAERNQQEIIAKIKEMARSIDRKVTIEDTLGRPPKKHTVARGSVKTTD